MGLAAETTRSQARRRGNASMRLLERSLAEPRRRGCRWFRCLALKVFCLLGITRSRFVLLCAVPFVFFVSVLGSSWADDRAEGCGDARAVRIPPQRDRDHEAARPPEHRKVSERDGGDGRGLHSFCSLHSFLGVA